MDLTGVWKADDGGTYYLRQDCDDLWWTGLSEDDDGSTFTNVFKGTIRSNDITGDWADVPRGRANSNGALELKLEYDPVGDLFLRKTSQIGPFGANVWENVWLIR